MTWLGDNNRSRGFLQFATSIGIKRLQRGVAFPEQAPKRTSRSEACNVLNTSSTYRNLLTVLRTFDQSENIDVSILDDLTSIDILSSMRVKVHRTLAGAGDDRDGAVCGESSWS